MDKTGRPAPCGGSSSRGGEDGAGAEIELVYVCIDCGRRFTVDDSDGGAKGRVSAACSWPGATSEGIAFFV